MRFADINGQKAVIGHFRNALKNRKVSHAYLLYGEEGAGGMEIALAFAQTLLCENPVQGEEGAEPCGTCASCLQAESLSHPDLMVAEREGASLGIDRIREINRDTGTLPYRSDHKVYILPDAHTMTAQAQNALLKTLEEPPAYVVMILLAPHTENFLPTVLSRLTPLRLSALSLQEVREGLKAREETAEAVAFFKNLKRRDFHDILSFTQEHDAARLVEDFSLWVRDLGLARAGAGTADTLIFAEEIQYISQCAGSLSYAALQRILDAVSTAKKRIFTKGNTDLIAALLFLEARDRLPDYDG